MAVDHAKLKELFVAACDLTNHEQQAFIELHCRGDVELQRDLQRLLKEDSATDGVLSDNAVVISLVASLSDVEEPLPCRIGRYRPLRRIGFGGMGVVYLAEQENPRREVAVKVVRPGQISPGPLQRFMLEANVLGRLQHPSIAQIVEAGMFDDGAGERPFFAMEYVDGVPLNEYMRSRETPVRARLDMFIQICDAVHHAHQRGIIHRDLKPANILVTSVGQPKILDFGVARATDSDLQVSTLQTDIGQIIGTIPYMSPEQISGRGHEIDTRSDIYALGVILYELLACRLPYDVGDRSIVQAARVISGHDPTPLTTINRTFRGDLNTIVLKALEKDPARRYQSALELAADIQRYLRDEPIVARPATTMYQLRKFARRNRMLVTGVVAVFLTLALGMVGTSFGIVTAREREREAHQQRQVAQAVNEFLNADLLGSANPYRGDGPDVSMRTILDRASQSIEDRFSGQPLVRAAIRVTLGRTYHGLGLYDESVAHLQRAVETYADTLGPDAEETIAARNSLASTHLRAFHLDEAEQLITETLERSERVLGDVHEETATALVNQAVMLKHRGRFAESEQHYRRALQGYRRTVGPFHRRALVTMNNLGLVLSNQRKHAEAEALYRELLDIQREVNGPRHPDTAFVMINLGDVLWTQSKAIDEVESLWREAYEIRREVLGEQHDDTLASQYGIAVVKSRRGEVVEAEQLLRQILEVHGRKSREDNYLFLLARHALANTLVKQDRLEEAEAIFRDVLAIRRQVLGLQHSETRRTRNALRTVLRMRGDDAAIRVVASDYLVRLRELAEDPGAHAELVEQWAWQLLTIEPEDLRDPAAALAAAERAAALSDRLDPDILDTLAVALSENGRFDEAIDVQKEAIALVDEENEDYRAELIARLDDIISRSNP